MSDAIQITLKPCPFCGKPAKYYPDDGYISCHDSEGGCGFYYNCDCDSEENSTKVWNRRTSDSLTSELLEACKVLVDNAVKNDTSRVKHYKVLPVFINELKAIIAKAGPTA